MKQLNNFLLERTYYVINGIIYNIGGLVYKPDSHGVVISADTNGDNTKIEKIFVNGKKYFLDSLIEDGDTYSSDEFKKTVHENDTTSGAKTMTYFDYYKFLCEEQLKQAIADNANLTYEELVVTKITDGQTEKTVFGKYFDRLGIPEFMITQYKQVYPNSTVTTGKTEAGATANFINLDEATFKDLKKKEVAKRLYDNAEELANGYGYNFADNNTLETSILNTLTPKT